MLVKGQKFVAGSLSDGRLSFERYNGVVVEAPVVVVRNVTLTGNADSTVNLVFSGS